MLNKPIEEIIVQNGKVVGVKSEGEVSNYCEENVLVLNSVVWTLVLHVEHIFVRSLGLSVLLKFFFKLQFFFFCSF